MIAAFGRANGIPVLETYQPLADAYKTGQTGLHYTLFDSHMTPKSHGILANALAKQLLARKLVPAY